MTTKFPIPKLRPGNPLTVDQWCFVRALIEQGDEDYICLAIDSVVYHPKLDYRHGRLEPLNTQEGLCDEACNWVVDHLGGCSSFGGYLASCHPEFYSRLVQGHDVAPGAERPGRLQWLDRIIAGAERASE